jgi:hypothetical protein
LLGLFVKIEQGHHVQQSRNAPPGLQSRNALLGIGSPLASCLIIRCSFWMKQTLQFAYRFLYATPGTPPYSANNDIYYCSAITFIVCVWQPGDLLFGEKAACNKVQASHVPW